MLRILLILSLTALICSKVFPFDKSVIQTVIKDHNPCLFLLTNTNETSNIAKQYFYELAQENDELMFSHSDSQDENTFYRKICDYLGVNYKQAPHIIYLSGQHHKYKFKGQLSKKNLQRFLQKAKAGSWEVFVKSQPVSQKSQVLLDLEGATFPKIVLNSQREFFIKLYAPWCSHCRAMAEEFDEVARMLGKNQNIMFAQMDYTVNEISGLEIPGYPTIKFYGKDKEIDPIDYEGERTAVEFVAWLKENTEYEWVEPMLAPGQEEGQEKGKTASQSTSTLEQL